MIQVGFRVHDATAKAVRKKAKEQNISESEVWRNIVSRGLSYEDMVATKIMLESLCLNRRIAATMDADILNSAREDTEILFSKIVNDKT